jgi:hypothetical protein
LEEEEPRVHKKVGVRVMSQTNVERVIGLLATDEAFRRRFEEDASETLRRVIEGGWPLTPCEFHALAALDPRHLARFAKGIDPRLQKSDLRGDGS